MINSLALIFLLGIILGGIFNKLKLPSLLGMILIGIVLGPHVLNLLDSNILLISGDLRKIALVIILTRAGLSLNVNELKRVGRPALLMCFIPAFFEIGAFMIFGPKLLGITLLDSAILGSVIAAVSPAVIVPRMIKLMEEKRGTKNSIPQLIMAAASVDDIIVIVLFTAFTGFAQGEGLTTSSILEVPFSIILGIVTGILLGIFLVWIFRRFKLRDSLKVVFILGISFLLVSLEDYLKGIVPFSGLISVMTIGVVILNKYEILAKRLGVKYSKLWVGAEILLFVLVGATVDIRYALALGMVSVILILLGLLFRVFGVYISLGGSRLTKKEKVFSMIAFSPKATVQAAIGGVPLAMGLPCGEIVLTVAVVSILITAPLGAIGIDKSYKKLLDSDKIE